MLMKSRLVTLFIVGSLAVSSAASAERFSYLGDVSKAQVKEDPLKKVILRGNRDIRSSGRRDSFDPGDLQSNYERLTAPTDQPVPIVSGAPTVGTFSSSFPSSQASTRRSSNVGSLASERMLGYRPQMGGVQNNRLPLSEERGLATTFQKGYSDSNSSQSNRWMQDIRQTCQGSSQNRAVYVRQPDGTLEKAPFTC